MVKDRYNPQSVFNDKIVSTLDAKSLSIYLPLGGSNAILGVHWSQTYTLRDFNNLFMPDLTLSSHRDIWLSNSGFKWYTNWLRKIFIGRHETVVNVENITALYFTVPVVQHTWWDVYTPSMNLYIIIQIVASWLSWSTQSINLGWFDIMFRSMSRSRQSLLLTALVNFFELIAFFFVRRHIKMIFLKSSLAISMV